MNRLKLLVMTAASMLSIATVAAEYPWLTFTLSDDTEVSVAADNLSINYAGGELQLMSTTVNQTLPVSQIKSMQFTTTMSGIEDQVAGRCDNFELYTTAGTMAGQFTSIEAARAVLPSGIYVVKNESGTFKVIF